MTAFSDLLGTIHKRQEDNRLERVPGEGREARLIIRVQSHKRRQMLYASRLDKSNNSRLQQA